MFCVKCGAEIEDGTQFCPKCGATQEPPVQAAAEQVYNAAPAAAAAPAAGKSKSIMALVFGIVSIVLSGFFSARWVGVILGVIGLVCAIIGLSMAKNARSEMAAAGIDPNTGTMAKVGKILSIIGLICAIIAIIVAIILAIIYCSLKKYLY
jgi:hypothetical protein